MIFQEKRRNEKDLVTKEMALSNLGENIFIGDLAATSNMTSNKLGVYNLVPINWSVMIGNGQSISCTHKGKLDVICRHKDESMVRETWDVKIVRQLNHDLFSFTKAMKEGWQMNGRWKDGGLVIELFMTTRPSTKFDRMIPSGSSWLVGIKVQRVLDHAHSAMEPGKIFSMSKLHQITRHTGEHLLRPTANYMRIKLTGKLAPCEVCAQAKIRQVNIPKKIMKKLPTRTGCRVFIDICSFKQVSRGGNRHWLIEDEKSFEKDSEEEEEIEGDGHIIPTQRKLGLYISMIGARKETLGKTRSQTKEMSSPRNESIERADLTMEDWIQETCLISAVTSGPTEPKTFQEAWHYPVENERDNWRVAIKKEIRSMIERGVWRKTDRKRIPSNRRLIGNKWVFKIKRDGTYRARLVALGYSQIPGVDYTDNFAPVAHDVSFRIALVRMMVEKLDSLVMDVETAFLYGEIDEEIFMKSPIEMEEIDPGSSSEDCYQLLKGIYGLCQAARQFWKKFVNTTKQGPFGFQVSPSDPCMLFKENELGVCIIIMYVDDMLIIGEKEQIQVFASKIQKEFS